MFKASKLFYKWSQTHLLSGNKSHPFKLIMLVSACCKEKKEKKKKTKEHYHTQGSLSRTQAELRQMRWQINTESNRMRNSGSELLF